MRRRGFFSILVLVVTAIVVELPLILLAVYFGGLYFMSGHIGGVTFLGVNAQPNLPYALNGGKLIQDRLYRANGRSMQPQLKKGRLQVASVVLDKHTNLDGSGTTVESGELGYDPGWRQSVFGDANNLWLVGQAHQDAKGAWVCDVFKLESNSFLPQAAMPHAQQRPMALQRPTANGSSYEYVQSDTFVLNSKLSTIYSLAPGRRELYQLLDSGWSSQGVIELLDIDRVWKNSSGKSILDRVPPPPRGWGTATDGLLEVLPIGGTAHLFWRLPGRLLYCRGFKLSASKSGGSQGGIQSDTDEPVSAQRPENFAGVSDEWLLVSDDLPCGTVWYPGMAGGEPIVIVIDNKNIGYPFAKALHLEQGEWSEYSRLDLPFSSYTTNLGSRDDGSATYFAATTESRRGGLFEAGRQDIRRTDVPYDFHPDGHKGYTVSYVVLKWSLIAGLILGLVATICMYRDPAIYEFGHQSVELASVTERGIARAIDGLLILGMTAGLALFLAHQWDFDWRTTAEAMQIRVYEHPSFAVGFRIAVITLGVLLVLILSYITVQGRFAVTPGKWICGLRIVQTSLRPCGFAKSLLRELLLFVENVYLISWTPAILLIAFTELRQRFGDRMADTIVVRARSLRKLL